MKKIEVIFEINRFEEYKEICDELNIIGAIFYEVKLYNPNGGVSRQYRGANYTVSQVSKLKSEVLVNEDVAELFIKAITDKIIDKNKLDKCLVCENIVEK